MYRVKVDIQMLRAIEYLIDLGESKRLLAQSGRIMKFARPWHPMFESREPSRFWDEYGMGNDDLDFAPVNALIPQK